MAAHTLRIKNPDGSTREMSFGDELTVGRSAEGNGLILADGGVSRRHARFFLAGDGSLQVEDVGSAHGTFVDGEKIAGPTSLSAGAVVHIGDYELVLQSVAPRAASQPGRSATGVARAARPASQAPVPGARSKSPSAVAASRPAGAAPPARATPPRSSPAQPRAKDAPRAEEGARPSALVRGAPKAAASRGPAGLARRGPSALASTAAPPPGPFPSIVGTSAPFSSRRINLRRGLNVVGRQGSIVVDDESLSRNHAEIEVAPDGIFVRDLGSANGTTVNGEAVGNEQVPLSTRDLVQFGAIRFEFDSGDVEALAAPTRRELVGSGKRGPVRASPAAGGQKRSAGLMIGGLAAILLIGAGIAWVKPLLGEDPQETRGGRGAGSGAQVDVKAQIQELISQCRSYSMVEFGSEPNWKKADAACDAALDLDPIHPEALELKKKIKFESEAWVLFEKGEKALGRQREEEALDQFARIPRESAYFNRARQLAADPINEVKRTTLNDCKRYSSSRRWKQALARCETYMALVCQEMPRDELYPPIGMKLTVNYRPKSDEWRPPDANYRRFLAAREKIEPDAPAWRCPEIPLFSGAKSGPDPKKDVEQALKEKFPDKELVNAAVRYWEGKAPEAEVALQRIISTSRMAAMHAPARDLLSDISSVRSLFGNGSSLVKDRFEEALEPFSEALQIDEKILGATLSESRPSYFRRTIQSDVARAAYDAGKVFADRDDFRKACQIWKLGFGMYKADLDLLRALQNACTRRAQGLLAEAESCPDFDRVIELAVPGDGLGEQAQEKKKALECL